MNMIVANSKSLNFTEEYITECLEENKPIFEWKDDKGPVRDWEVPAMVGNWSLVVVTETPTRGHICPRPTGAATLKIFRESKVREYAQFGIDEIFSRIYLKRSRHIRYALNNKTVVWIWKHFLMPESDLIAMEQSPDQLKTAAELGYDARTSAQKFEKWLLIIRLMRRDDQGFNYALSALSELSLAQAERLVEEEDLIKALANEGVTVDDVQCYTARKALQLVICYLKSKVA